MKAAKKQSSASASSSMLPHFLRTRAGPGCRGALSVAAAVQQHVREVIHKTGSESLVLTTCRHVQAKVKISSRSALFTLQH